MIPAESPEIEVNELLAASGNVATLSIVAEPVTPVVVIPAPVKPSVIGPLVFAEGVIDIILLSHRS